MYSVLPVYEAGRLKASTTMSRKEQVITAINTIIAVIIVINSITIVAVCTSFLEH